MDHVLVIALGATLFLAHDKSNDAMRPTYPPTSLLRHIPTHIRDRDGLTTHVVDLAASVRTGANLTLLTILRTRDMILSERRRTPSHRSIGVIVVAGTDTLDEFAFALRCLMPSALLREHRVAVGMTGAVRPSDIEAADGPTNFAGCCQVVDDVLARCTTVSSSNNNNNNNKNGRILGDALVHVVIGSVIHSPFDVVKTCSRGGGDGVPAFESVDGVTGRIIATGVGIVDRGTVRWTGHSGGHETAPWRNTRQVARMCRDWIRPGVWDSLAADILDEFASLTVDDLGSCARRRVAVLTLGTGMNGIDTDIGDQQQSGGNASTAAHLQSHSTSRGGGGGGAGGGGVASLSVALATLVRSHGTDTAPRKDADMAWDPTLQIPAALLKSVDGLVLSLPGTASLPSATFTWLRSHMERHGIPIVLTSRCWTGPTYDDQYYRGSLRHYERSGFVVSAFEGLRTPFQARLVLLLLFAVEDRAVRRSLSFLQSSSSSSHPVKAHL